MSKRPWIEIQDRSQSPKTFRYQVKGNRRLRWQERKEVHYAFLSSSQEDFSFSPERPGILVNLIRNFSRGLRDVYLENVELMAPVGQQVPHLKLTFIGWKPVKRSLWHTYDLVTADAERLEILMSKKSGF